MIAEINHPNFWNPLFESVVMTVLYAAMFALSFAISCKREELGFKILAAACGIWLINIVCIWTMNPFVINLTNFLFPIGQIVMVTGLSMLLRTFSKNAETEDGSKSN